MNHQTKRIKQTIIIQDLAVLEENNNQEVTTPDTASFSGISVFLGVAILGGTTYYLLKKTEVIK